MNSGSLLRILSRATNHNPFKLIFSHWGYSQERGGGAVNPLTAFRMERGNDKKFHKTFTPHQRVWGFSAKLVQLVQESIRTDSKAQQAATL